MALTATACKNPEPGDKPRKLADAGGLCLGGHAADHCTPVKRLS